MKNNMNPTFFFNTLDIKVINGYLFVKTDLIWSNPVLYDHRVKQYLLDHNMDSVEVNEFDGSEKSKVVLSEFLEEHRIQHFSMREAKLLDSILDILANSLVTRLTYTYDVIDLDRLPPQLCIQLEMLKCHAWTGDLRNLPNLCVLSCSLLNEDTDQLTNIVHLKTRRWLEFASEKLETLIIDETQRVIVDLDQFPNLTRVESHTCRVDIKIVRTLSEPLEFLSSRTIPNFSVLNLFLRSDIIVDGKYVFDRVPGLRKLTILTPTSITDYGNDDSLVNLS